MIELRPMPEATVTPGQPKMLQEGFFVRFTDVWPVTLPHVSGKFFTIARTNEVSHDIHHILPMNDYRDVDLSNSAGGENIYPENTRTLYEVALGFKPGNYLVHFYIPAGEFVHRLEQAGMVPNVANVTLRYLGAIKPEDSPYNDKRIFLYFVKDLEPLILRTYVDSGQPSGDIVHTVTGYEKCVFGLTINKCYLEEIKAPSAEQWAKSKKLLYYSELRW